MQSQGGGEPDGDPVSEEMLRGILAERKYWAGLKCSKNQASSRAQPYVPPAFVLSITCDVRHHVGIEHIMGGGG